MLSQEELELVVNLVCCTVRYFWLFILTPVFEFCISFAVYICKVQMPCVFTICQALNRKQEQTQNDFFNQKKKYCCWHTYIRTPSGYFLNEKKKCVV